jgi:hypothetical protein
VLSPSHSCQGLSSEALIARPEPSAALKRVVDRLLRTADQVRHLVFCV